MPSILLRSLVLASLTLLSTKPAATASPVSNVTNPASPVSNDTKPEPPVVDLGYAKYEGTSLPIGVNQFLGMKYAEPPTGGLRWREPQDPIEESAEVSSAENVSQPKSRSMATRKHPETDASSHYSSSGQFVSECPRTWPPSTSPQAKTVSTSTSSRRQTLPRTPSYPSYSSSRAAATPRTRTPTTTAPTSSRIPATTWSWSTSTTASAPWGSSPARRSGPMAL